MKLLTAKQTAKIMEDCLTCYFKGDLHVYTGNRKMLYGKEAYETKSMEGAHEGKLFWTYDAPAEA